MKRQYGYKLKVLLSDNGGEFKNSKIEAYCQRKGIRQEFTTPHEAHQRGKIERHVGTIKQTIRSLLFQNKVPVRFWDKAALYGCAIWNAVPRKSAAESPMQIFCKKQPRYDKFRIFGAKGYAKIHKKLSVRLKNPRILFLGFPPDTAGFLVFNLESKKLQIVRDIALDELHVINRPSITSPHIPAQKIRRRNNNSTCNNETDQDINQEYFQVEDDNNNTSMTEPTN